VGGISLNVSTTSFDLNPGDSRSFTVTLTNTDALPKPGIPLLVTAPSGLNGDVTVQTSDSSCSGSGGTSVSCDVTLSARGQKALSFALVAKNPDSLSAGQSRSDSTGTVAIENGSSIGYTVTLHGPAKSTAVTGVSGVVTDATTGLPVKSATVVLQDGAGTTFQTTSGSSGTFAFTSTQSRPIREGTLTITVTRDRYATGATKTFGASAGQSVTGVQITLTPVAAAGASGSASPSDPAASASASASEGAQAVRRAGMGLLSWALIGFGALLLLFGIGLILLVLARRRDEPDQTQVYG
jgi:hypothetical protein